jgi:26S proteasome regulatory subunit T6
MTVAGKSPVQGDGLRNYYKSKIEDFELQVKDKSLNLKRLEAQRNELNTQGLFYLT